MKSTVSGSQSSTTSTRGRKRLMADVDKMHTFIFSLFDKITSNINIPQLVYFPFLLFFAIQLVSTSLWTRHSNFWTPDLIDLFLYIPNFQPMTRNNLTEEILFGVYTGITLITFLMFIYLYIANKFSKKLSKSILYTYRFLTELISLVMIGPINNEVGKFFVIVFKGDSNELEIIILTFVVIELVFQYFVLFITYKYISSSAILSLSPFSAFDIDPMMKIITILPFFLMCDQISSFFDVWTHYVVVVLHLFFVILLNIKLRQRPFVSDFMNYFIGFVIWVLILFDIIGFATFFLNKPSYIVMVVVYCAAVLIAACIETALYITQTKKWMEIVKKPFTTDEEKLEIMRDLMISKSVSQFNKFYFFVITKKVKQFLDTMFIKVALEGHDDLPTLARCARFLAYLPTEYRLMNITINRIEMRPKLPNDIKFLIFQIQKILIVRQSSQSSEVVERFLGNVKESRDIVQAMKNFWLKTNVSTWDMVHYYDLINFRRAKWEEILNDIPNTSYYLRIYANYLIDGCTDFKEAVINTHKANMIDSGVTFHHDICFRHFVRNFPEILKKKIMDTKGNFIDDKRDGKKTHSSSNKNSNQHSSTSSLSTLDPKIEENLGKTLVSSYRLRIALQGVTHTKKAKIEIFFVAYIILDLLISLAAAALIFFYFNDYFTERNKVARRAEYCNQMRFSYVSAIMNLILLYGEGTDTINTKEFFKPIRAMEPYNNQIFTFERDYTYNIMELVISSKDNYTSLMRSLAYVARKQSIVKIAYNLLEEVVPAIFCSSGLPAPELKINMITLMANNFIGIQMTAINSNYPDWWHSVSSWCSLMSSLQYTSKYYRELADSLLLMGIDEMASSKSVILQMTIIIPILYFLIVFVGTLLTILMAKKEINKFTCLLLDMDPTIKKEAMSSLCKKEDMVNDNENENDVQMYEGGKKFNELVLFVVLSGFCALAEVCLIVGHLMTINQSNVNINNAIMWITHSRIRKSVAMEACLWSHVYMLFGGGMTSNITNIQSLKVILQTSLGRLNQATNELHSDQGDTPAIIGVDKKIDFFEMSEQCKTNTSEVRYHEQYRCGSTLNLVTNFGNMVNEIILKNNEYGGKITDGIPALMLEIVIEHMLVLFLRIDSEIQNLANGYISSHSLYNAVFFAVEVVVAFILLFFMTRVNVLFRKAYNAVLIFLRRVSPFAIVQSQGLMDYMLNRSASLNTAKSIWQNIFASSNDGILCISVTGLIEIINPAVSATFGFTPDQIIGQQMSEIIEESDLPKINTALDMMANGQSPTLYEDHIKCITDANLIVKCQVTIIGIKKHDSIESFIIILRDETTLMEQQDEAEEAKKKSENLLYQIIPRSIAAKLNQGDKEVSFVVQNATIMFIDIVKFSEFSASLSPSDIMCVLTNVFELFDNHMKKFSCITKIKLIGDVHMSASGLFNEKDSPQFHAVQMLKFGTECILSLDEFNIKSNMLLAVRVGINSGGPIIAGVLGTDKPTFDIIGDPINVASRLQSTGLPGHIQISQDTHNLIAESDIEDVYRGETMLKGKGKTRTYTVAPRKFNFNGTFDDLMTTEGTI